MFNASAHHLIQKLWYVQQFSLIRDQIACKRIKGLGKIKGLGLQPQTRRCNLKVHFSMGPSDSGDMAKFEGLVSLSLRVSSRTIRPERVLHFMFCFQQ